MITKKNVAEKLLDYLHHTITITELVNWAETAFFEEDFDNNDFETIKSILSQLGLADVRAFGLTWDDCEKFFEQLGYSTRVEVVEM